jgi:aspartate/methionine/tyrosine aminotransferase
MQVYENITYDAEHVRFASLPGMWERTLTFSSAAKTFSVTGWKVGWCVGPSDLLKSVSGIGE